jgi:hypothetical protein
MYVHGRIAARRTIPSQKAGQLGAQPPRAGPTEAGIVAGAEKVIDAVAMTHGRPKGHHRQQDQNQPGHGFGENFDNGNVAAGCRRGGSRCRDRWCYGSGNGSGHGSGSHRYRRFNGCINWYGRLNWCSNGYGSFHRYWNGSFDGSHRCDGSHG